MSGKVEDKQEACKTYLEQTKLLVTLASAFIVAPPALFSLLRGKEAILLSSPDIRWMIGAEVLFVLSVLLGYVVVGTIAGEQDAGTYNVFRPATRISSLAQLAFYLLGLAAFVRLTVQVFSGL